MPSADLRKCCIRNGKKGVETAYQIPTTTNIEMILNHTTPSNEMRIYSIQSFGRGHRNINSYSIRLQYCLCLCRCLEIHSNFIYGIVAAVTHGIETILEIVSNLQKLSLSLSAKILNGLILNSNI